MLTQPKIINKLRGFVRSGFFLLGRTVEPETPCDIPHTGVNLSEKHVVNVEQRQLSYMLIKT